LAKRAKSKAPQKTKAAAKSGKSRAQARLNDDIGEAKRLEMFQMQLEVRLLENRANDLFLQNLVKGTIHLSVGMEAVAAGCGAAMRKNDYSFCTYRGHAHTMARGVPMTAVLGELMGRECGLLSGKGGSMHLTSVEHGAMGSYAIIGAHLPIAVGAAWSAQYRGSNQVSVCFFGDGATNIGAFHEALNLAAIWKLPVVFVCENNLYMEYTPIADVTAVENPAADRASAYGLEKIIVDGNDPDAVYRVAREAIEMARGGGGPSIIEALTYRHLGHSRADPGTYRPPEEIEAWKKRDPIPMYRQRLLDYGVAEATVSGIEDAVMQALDEATEEAKASPTPAIALADTEVWADGGSSWRN
jgi:pyruvate dehydrogenase E1 component alpha subunit